MIKFILNFCFILCFTGVLFAQGIEEGWKERYNKNGLSIYIRHHKEKKTVEFKSLITINAPMDSCAALLRNFDAHPNFLYRVKTVKLIEMDDQSPIIYYTLDFPFPLTDRDMVIQGKITPKPNSKEIVFELESIPDKLPKTNKVRIRTVDGSWILKKVGEQQTQITNYGESTTKGLPTWLVNLLIYQIPKSTLTKYKAILEPKSTG